MVPITEEQEASPTSAWQPEAELNKVFGPDKVTRAFKAAAWISVIICVAVLGGIAYHVTRSPSLSPVVNNGRSTVQLQPSSPASPPASPPGSPVAKSRQHGDDGRSDDGGHGDRG